MSRLLTALAIAGIVVATVQAAGLNREPEDAEAVGPAVAAVAAGVGIRTLIASGVVSGVVSAGSYQLGQVIDGAHSRGHYIKTHQRRFDGYLYKLRNNYRVVGRDVWRHVNRRVSTLARWIRNNFSAKKLRERWPRAAWACVVAGTTSYLLNGDFKDALHACIGAGVGVLAGPSKRKGEAWSGLR